MRYIITLLLLVFPVTSFAQNQGGGQPDMQKLMQAAQEMMQCMAKIDQEQLSALEEQGEQFEQEVSELCKQGKRKQAQEKAMAYAREMRKNPALMHMEKCAEINKKYGVPMDEEDSSIMVSEEDLARQHVCDDLGDQ